MRDYEIKTDPFDEGKIKRLIKEIHDEAKEDRKKAFDAFDYFKSIVDNEGDPAMEDHSRSVAAQKAMVDCLKLAQDAKNKALKALEVLAKIRNVKKGKDDDSPFATFNDMT